MKVGSKDNRKTHVTLAYDVQAVKAKHPVRPRRKPVDIAAKHAEIAARYPKVLAELAK